MKKPGVPENEQPRLRKLREYEILDTAPESAFDALTALAAHIAGVPIALVSLVDADRQWFKSRYGLDAPETPRDVSFCGHVVAAEAPLFVPDALQDPRFADNPLVTGDPRVRFYAGVPLRTADGFVLGTLCAIDRQARDLTARQRELLAMLARQVVDQLELRRQTLLLRSAQVALERDLREMGDVTSRLQSILASANVSIVETTPDGMIREFNPAAERMLGYAASEVVGTASPAIFHDVEEVRASALELTAELGVTVEPGFEAFIAKARRGEASERDWTYIHKDGTRLPVHLSVTARRDPEGQVVGYMGIASDISARKESERVMENRALASKLGAELGEAFRMDVGLPRILRACAEIVAANLDAAFARIWTLNVAENVLELKASAGQYIHTWGPHGRVPVGASHIGMIAKERRPIMTNSVVGDPSFVGQSWARRESMVSFAGYPLVVDGRLIGVVAMFAKRSLSPRVLDALGVAAASVAVGIERKEAEARLRESEARSRSIVDTAADAVITIDVRGLVAHANPATERLFGYSAAELFGHNINVLMPSPDRAQHDGYLANYAKTGHRNVIGIGREVTAARKDGSTFPAELAVSEFFIEGKKFFTGVVRDISDRKRIERLQSEFVSTVSHELRTPLTSIRGALGLIAGGVTGELPETAKQYVDIALSNSDRLVRLINDILDIEKMESGSMTFRRRALDLGAAVRTAISANRAFASSHTVRLALASEIPAGEVVADSDRLAQVLTNLISNAAKFSPSNGVVELAVERVGRWFRVSIRDHGPGISEEFRGRIFQRFAQADASSTRQTGGTGLGLSISKALVERMHGRIGFEPADGGGTVFFFELPYLPPVEVADAGPRAGRVLVCEDDRDVSDALEKLLSVAGFSVHIAPTLERARRLLALHRYDAITLDLVLADGHSATLIGELRSVEASRMTPIVVVSGPRLRVGYSVVAVADVLVKPVDEGRLLSALRAAAVSFGEASPRLLVVEDDDETYRIVKRTVPASWTVRAADSIDAAKTALDEASCDVVVLDLTLRDGAGDELKELASGAHIAILAALDASAEVSQKVASALVKSRSNPVEVRDTIVSLITNSRIPPERT